MNTNIVIADELKLLRCGLKSIIKQMPIDIMHGVSEKHSYRIIADVATPDELANILETHHIDLLLLGHTLDTAKRSPNPVSSMDGFTLLRWLIKKYPKLKVLIISPYENINIIRMALELGVSGYVSMNTSESVLEQAIKSVLNNELYIEKRLMRSLFYRNENLNTDLSVKETEVLRLLCKGLSMTTIASHMNLSVKTVSAHKIKAMNKLNVSSDCQLYTLLSKTKRFEMVTLNQQ